MKETGIRKEVLEEIRGLAKKYHIGKVVLFGSRARGDYKRASDIDLAVCGGNVSRFALEVEEETSTPLKYDVIDLDENVGEALRTSIETEGILLYEEV
ncbi:MAG: nucleotidyltransferase domain-containing protein [Lachnospiraceae bacterium]|nr:nucleotidyltransferase domain-containing protein [Lachnospiraceae bacterium]